MQDKTCRICHDRFTPTRTFQKNCSEGCDAIQKVRDREKVKKKENTKVKKEFHENDRVLLRAKAQKLVNKYARLRDQYENGYRCCSCGITKGKMDGGHFLPTSSYSAIRYNTNQIHQQCVGCNQYRNGMPIEYKKFMVNKYGDEYVNKLQLLKGVTRRYSTEYLQKLIKIVSRKIKIMEKKI